MRASYRIAGAGVAMALAMAAAPPSRWFRVSLDPSFADARAQLQVLVDEQGNRSANRFCVVGERIDGVDQAYVHWVTENRLILWEAQTDNPRAIAGSRRNLDLRHDVVDGRDVHGSTYRVTRGWVNRILMACRRTGDRYAVERRTGDHD